MEHREELQHLSSVRCQGKQRPVRPATPHRTPLVSRSDGSSFRLYRGNRTGLACTACPCCRDKEYPGIVPLQQLLKKMAPIVVDCGIQTDALSQWFGFPVCCGELLNSVFNCLHDVIRDDKPAPHNTNLDTACGKPRCTLRQGRRAGLLPILASGERYITMLSFFMAPSPLSPSTLYYLLVRRGYAECPTERNRTVPTPKIRPRLKHARCLRE